MAWSAPRTNGSPNDFAGFRPSLSQVFRGFSVGLPVPLSSRMGGRLSRERRVGVVAGGALRTPFVMCSGRKHRQGDAAAARDGAADSAILTRNLCHSLPRRGWPAATDSARTEDRPEARKPDLQAGKPCPTLSAFRCPKGRVTDRCRYAAQLAWPAAKAVCWTASPPGTGLLARRAADYASARAQRSATRCRRRRPRDGSIRRQRTMDPDSRRRTHGLRTYEECLGLPRGQTPFRTILPGLGRAFPGSFVDFRWAFLSRPRHTWMAGLSRGCRLGGSRGDAPGGSVNPAPTAVPVSAAVAAASGFHPAMVRAHALACSLSVMPGNSRRSSTAPASSPP